MALKHTENIIVLSGSVFLLRLGSVQAKLMYPFATSVKPKFPLIERLSGLAAGKVMLVYCK